MMKTILIADDDKKIVAALALRLRFAGYNVITAQTGEAALRAVNGSHPDLVLMDIWMPAGTGLTVAESLRAGGCELPIIFMTASRKQGLWASAQEVGGSGFLEKPYDPVRLLKLVGQAVDGTATPGKRGI